MESNDGLRVLFVAPFYDERGADPAETLQRFPLLTELPRQLQARGHQVQLLGLAPSHARHELDGIHYRWVAAAAPVRFAGGMLHRWRPHYGPAYYQPSLKLVRIARAMKPDIVHVFGLTMDLQLALIRLLASRRSRIVAHYHGGEPAVGRLRRQLQNLSLGRIDAACFTARAQARPWVGAGLIEPGTVHEVLETSSPFTGVERERARALTGMAGDPVYLSAGRLHPIKDPLTMLQGFAHIARRQPDARLYLYYLTDEMLHDARALVHSFPQLRARVEFRGRARPEEMETIYSSADILLQASIREWSGLAILEAMSCGCIPVVSAIPSFRAMVGDEGHGRFFEPGDAVGLADAALSIDDRQALSAAVEHHFREQLSFAALARDLEQIYRSLAASE